MTHYTSQEIEECLSVMYAPCLLGGRGPQDLIVKVQKGRCQFFRWHREAKL
jgi:hypothetical protein